MEINRCLLSFIYRLISYYFSVFKIRIRIKLNININYNSHVTTKTLLYTTKAGLFTTFLSINTIKTKVLTNDTLDSNIILLIADEL